MNYEARKKLNSDFLNGPYAGRMIMGIMSFFKEKTSDDLSGEEIKNVWKEYLSENEGKDLKLNLYTNIPFCIRKCSFCLYNSKELNKDDNILQYVDNIVTHYRYFADIFKDRAFSSFYFGGGTPNILGAAETEKVLSALRENYAFKEGGEKTFEGNPLLAGEEKMKILAKYGVNRVSFGVQSFDQETLERNNRGFQREDFIQKAIDLAKCAGIRHINLDLIIGFNNDTKESVTRDFERIIKMGATSVCIYPLRASNSYLKDFWNGNEEMFRESKKQLINDTIAAVVEVGDRYGYEFPLLGQTFNDLGDGTGFIFKKKDVPDFSGGDQFCTDDFNGVSSILGIGQFAVSKIHGNRVIYTNEKGISHTPEKDFFFTSQLSQKEMLMDDFAKRFVSFNSIDTNDEIVRTGIDPLYCFTEEMEALKKHGRITVQDGKIVFIENDLKRRMNDLLFFVDEGAISESLDDFKEANKFNKIKEENMDNLYNEEEYSRQTELREKISKLGDRVPSTVVDGYLINLSKEKIGLRNLNDEEKEFALDDECMTVKQVAVRSSDGEKNYWKIITEEELTDNVKLSLIVSKDENKVLLIKKVEVLDA